MTPAAATIIPAATETDIISFFLLFLSFCSLRLSFRAAAFFSRSFFLFSSSETDFLLRIAVSIVFFISIILSFKFISLLPDESLPSFLFLPDSLPVFLPPADEKAFVLSPDIPLGKFHPALEFSLSPFFLYLRLFFCCSSHCCRLRR